MNFWCLPSAKLLEKSLRFSSNDFSISAQLEQMRMAANENDPSDTYFWLVGILVTLSLVLLWPF